MHTSNFCYETNTFALKQELSHSTLRLICILAYKYMGILFSILSVKLFDLLLQIFFQEYPQQNTKY